MNNSPTPSLDSGIADFCRQLSAEIGVEGFRPLVEKFADLKVLVVGDTIIDRYSYLQVQGLTSKNRIISGRFLGEETQAGGALAVLRHVRQFTSNIRFLSLVGTEPWVEPFLKENILPAEDAVIRDASFTSIIKQRFVEPLSKGKEMSKLFAVNYLDGKPPSSKIQEQVIVRLTEEMKGVDAVLLLDFGHGLMQPAVRELVQESASFLALNCQTNSNNHGFNIISRKYQRADAFSLDAQELMLSCGLRDLDYAAELEALRFHLSSQYAWLTRGNVDTIGLHRDGAKNLCPPLESDIVDTVGAGDAFFSVAALAAAAKLPLSLGTFLGQLAGAQAIKIVGNANPISKKVLLETGYNFLKSSQS